MLLAYLDESFTKERYLIAALLVPDADARSLTSALDEIVEEASWDYPVSREAELHAHDLVGGKRDWAKLEPKIRVRIGIYKKGISGDRRP